MIFYTNIWETTCIGSNLQSHSALTLVVIKGKANISQIHQGLAYQVLL